MSRTLDQPGDHRGIEPRASLEETGTMEDRIRDRAHELYLARMETSSGAQEGSAMADWIRAEAEIRSQLEEASAAAS